MRFGDDYVRRCDRSSLRILGSVGEVGGAQCAGAHMSAPALTMPGRETTLLGLLPATHALLVSRSKHAAAPLPILPSSPSAHQPGGLALVPRRARCAVLRCDCCGGPGGCTAPHLLSPHALACCAHARPHARSSWGRLEQASWDPTAAAPRPTRRWWAAASAACATRGSRPRPEVRWVGFQARWPCAMAARPPYLLPCLQPTCVCCVSLFSLQAT